MDKEIVDDRRFTMAAALATVMSKMFGLRGTQFSSLLERCPTFVSKEKSKARFTGKCRKVILMYLLYLLYKLFITTLFYMTQLLL